MEKHKFKFEFGKPKGQKRIVSLDIEWAKNWRAKEKFVPFCVSIHSIYYDDRDNSSNLNLYNLYMKSELYFRKPNDTSSSFVEHVDKILGSY